MVEAVNEYSSVLDLGEVPENSLSELIEIFSRISLHEKQNHLLVLYRPLSKYINRLTPFSKLKELTQISKVVWLDEEIDENIFKSFESLVFLIEDAYENIETMSDIIKRKILPLDQKFILSCIFTSANQYSDSLIVENLNLKGDIDIYFWKNLKPIKILNDLLILDNKNSDLKNLYQLNSISSLSQLAETLIKLIMFSKFKMRITNIFKKGILSFKFVDIFLKDLEIFKNSLDSKDKKALNNIEDCLFLDSNSFFNKQCDLIVLERSIDLISPLLTQLTYMGLIDEFYKIDLNQIEIENLNHTESNNNAQTSIISFDDDNFFQEELKDLNFSKVGPILNFKAKFLQQEFENRHKIKDNLNEMKSFVKRLNDLTNQQNLIKNHTLIAESILNKVKNNNNEDTIKLDLIEGEQDDEDDSYFSKFIDLQQQILSNNLDNSSNCDQILKFLYIYDPPLKDFFRLLILTSIVKRGIRFKEYNSFKKEILEHYGFDKLILLNKLRDLKLFYIREGTNESNFTLLFNNRNNNTSINNGNTTNNNENLHSDTNNFQSSAQLIKDFADLSYNLNLLPDGNNTNLEEEPDFVLPGYIPVITRLIQSIYSRDFMINNTLKPNDAQPLKKFNWENLNQYLSPDYYKNFEKDEFTEELLIPESKSQIFKHAQPRTTNKEEELIILVMIGGITYAELASIRFIINKINKDKGYNKKLIVLTNGIIKGDDIIEMCS
ncbi:hypothetical protein PACTADRAFT_2254 [Pachysolen tannophilus NRRL Y-2460]|uniref:Uncharacterized protein n=1 Tax=Pachysolen tannophilus NRRL Y-2460 TaxID=669874 RepID=A0A1E4TW36_PACTA|nr:hypothetical protein PACTADRAFT_2254 [Pachysolen tannophilus NRRL Y-2460]